MNYKEEQLLKSRKKLLKAQVKRLMSLLLDLPDIPEKNIALLYSRDILREIEAFDSEIETRVNKKLIFFIPNA